MKKVPSTVVKKRSRELTSVFESFTPYQGMEGRIERILITEVAADGIHLVGHTKGYVQVLVIAPESMLGTSTDVKITSVGRWSVFGEVIETPNQIKKQNFSGNSILDDCFPCSDPYNKSTSSMLPEPCVCAPQSSGESNGNIGHHEAPDADIMGKTCTKEQNSRKPILSLQSLLLRKRKIHVPERIDVMLSLDSKMQENHRRGDKLNFLDWILLGGILVSFLVMVVLLCRIGL